MKWREVLEPGPFHSPVGSLSKEHTQGRCESATTGGENEYVAVEEITGFRYLASRLSDEWTQMEHLLGTVESAPETACHK